MTIQEEVYAHTQTLCDKLTAQHELLGMTFHGTKFIIETGRKYLKIVCVHYPYQRSVHAFVDKNTGEVYKSASWKAPAKGVRFNLMNKESRNLCYANCDVYGGYLYLR
jgi:hypothetical protein